MSSTERPARSKRKCEGKCIGVLEMKRQENFYFFLIQACKISG